MPGRQTKRLLFNFSSLGIIQVSNFLLSLIVIPFVIRKVGAEGFGIVAVAQVVMFYLSVLSDYGFNRTAIRDIALYRSDPQRISRIFSTVLASKIFLTVFAFFLLLLLLMVVPLFRAHTYVYILAFSFVIGQTLLVNWFFQGMEKMHLMAIASLFSRLIYVILVLLFIRERSDLPLYLFFMGVGNIIAGIVTIFMAVRLYDLKWIPPKFSDIRYEIKNGWPVTLTNLSMTTTQYVGLFILRLFTNDLLVGYYSIAEKIFFAMKLMLDVFTQTVYPRVCKLLQEGWESLMPFFRKVFLPFFGLVLLGAALVFILSSELVRFFAGHESDEAAFILRFLCVAVPIVCLNIPACLILLAGDHKKNYLRIFVAGTIINVLANLLLAPSLEGIGTSLAVLITEVFITLGLYREVYRIYR